MNPVFYLLLILALVGAWFILAPIFRSIGGFFSGISDNAKNHMFDERKEN